MTDPSLQRLLENAPIPHVTSGRYEGWLVNMIRRRAYEIYEAQGSQPGRVEGSALPFVSYCRA